MTRAARETMHKYFDLEVALLEIKPRIWRRFLLRDNARFATLHLAIQEAGGWWNYHMYAFRTTMGYDETDQIAGIPTDDFVEQPAPDAATVKVASYFGGDKVDRCYYLYDFGDDWWHEVILRGVIAFPENFTRRLTGGARAFPHEDCGSIDGYYNCVKAALGKDRGLEDPEGLREWLEGWQPEAFDLEKVKKAFDR